MVSGSRALMPVDVEPHQIKVLRFDIAKIKISLDWLEWSLHLYFPEYKILLKSRKWRYILNICITDL